MKTTTHAHKYNPGAAEENDEISFLGKNPLTQPNTGSFIKKLLESCPGGLGTEFLHALLLRPYENPAGLVNASDFSPGFKCGPTVYLLFPAMPFAHGSPIPACFRRPVLMFSSSLNLILRMTLKSDEFTEIRQDTLIRHASPVTRAQAPTPHRCHHEGRGVFLRCMCIPWGVRSNAQMPRELARWPQRLKY